MGEQSNAYRILLRYDRKSRHRRIKKQRRYERLAATSQFRYTSGLQIPLDHFSAVCTAGSDCTLSGGRSPYLKHVFRHTHTLPSVEPPSYQPVTVEGARSAADCLYSLSFYLSAPSRLHMGALLSMSGIEDLTRVSRIQVCCPTNAPNRLHLSHLPAQLNKDRTRLWWGNRAWDIIYKASSLW